MTAAALHRHLPALLLTAACSLALTAGAWLSARQDAESEARNRFEFHVQEIADALRGRMLDYEQVLRGCTGLFAASDHVDRGEWRTYVSALALEQSYPGVRGIGFAPLVTEAGRAAHEAAVRDEGYPGHTIFPVGPRDAYAPVLYIEPFEGRNRQSFGFDMRSDPVRRAALDVAGDSGRAVLSGPAAPAPGTKADTQAVVILVLPVYRQGVPVGSIPERRAALQGYVYSPFRLGDLLAGVIGREAGVSLRLTDVTVPERPEMLLDDPVDDARPRLRRTLAFEVAGRNWQLEAASRRALEVEVTSNRPSLVLGVGLTITALLLLIVWTLANTRERARELAQHMTTALRASEERLQLALTSSRLALFDWDVRAGLVQLSSEWSAMLGGERSPTLVPIQKLQLLDHPDDQAAVQEKARALLRGEIDDYRMEHRVRRLDGGWLWIETVARANERAPDGRALRVTGANTDIEERKAVERLKSEFIATVSHELRTPLTSMIGSLGLLREGSAGELGADARRFVDIAYANSERLAELVNDILDMERIEAGRLDLRPEAVALDELLARAVELHAGYAQRHQVRYVLAGVPPGLRVLADPDRLMQVLANLLSNAAKHSPAGADVALAANAGEASVRIAVTDRGPGIAPEFRARLFGKFEQASRQRGGTGLGLAISKALVERMQGKIGCDSEPGRGSCFWIELPKA